MIARVDVSRSAEFFTGSLLGISDDPSVVHLFIEFESAVNEQRFVDVDVLENQVAALHPAFLVPGQAQMPVSDLQIFVRDGRVSFQIADEDGAATPCVAVV